MPVPVVVALAVCSIVACAVVGGLVAARLFDRIHRAA